MLSKCASILAPESRSLCADLGILGMRLAFGGTMALAHGLGKLQAYSEKSASFPDPLGVGPATSMALAVFGEFFCSLAVALGLLTRLSVIPSIVTMGVAFFIVHGGDPFTKKEMAFLYLSAFLAILITGPGRFSVDRLIFRQKTLGA